jgi:hypothetical protein
MSDAAIALPPFRIVASVLRKTTERLAREVVQPSGSAPDWNELEWGVARSVVAMQGTAALLAQCLRWRGPPGWRRYLEQQREQLLLRDARIGRLLERIDAAARVARIGCVALKGSALRALGVYRPGERPMGDVDLLVRPAAAAAVAAVLGGIGYVEAFVTERHTTYDPREKSKASDYREDAGNPIPIEVHTFVAEPLPVRKVDITERLQSACARPGLNPYPSLAALMLHLLLHAAGNMKAHALRQIQLHDLALLTSRFGDADWQALADAADELWWAYPPLALTRRYYGCEVPAALLRALRRGCPRLLRHACYREELTDVSWSNLRIRAFPGLAWSQTPLDALRYIRGRALPTRTTRAMMQGAMARHPHFTRVPWYQLPQSVRIVRWLVSRPPRVQTIVSVTAALRDAGR